MIIALIVLAAWLTGWAVTTRRLFARWRPSRVPLCKAQHFDWQGNKMGHPAKCYRRRKADLTSVQIDHDSHAAGWAVFAALLWPAVLIGLALMARPTELPEEKRKRVADMEKEAGIE